MKHPASTSVPLRIRKSTLTIAVTGLRTNSLGEINRIEREMHQYLEWESNVDPVTLKDFEEMMRKDLAGPGPCSTYPTVDEEVAPTAFRDTLPS